MLLLRAFEVLPQVTQRTFGVKAYLSKRSTKSRSFVTTSTSAFREAA